MKTILLALLCAPFVSYAMDTSYDLNRNCTSNVAAETIQAELKTIDEHIPNIPPDEDAYYRKEYGAIMGSKSLSRSVRGERYADLEKRNLFHAWLYRERLASLTIKLAKLLDDKSELYGPYKNLEANRLLYAINLTNDIHHFTSITADYINQDPKNRHANFASIGLGFSNIGSSLVELMCCKLNKITN